MSDPAVAKQPGQMQKVARELGKLRPLVETGERYQAVVQQAEDARALTREEGLPRRPWFRHHIYAPGFYTGYGVKTLPGVREAVEERYWEEAAEQIDLLADVLESVADQIDAAAAVAP